MFFVRFFFSVLFVCLFVCFLFSFVCLVVFFWGGAQALVILPSVLFRSYWTDLPEILHVEFSEANPRKSSIGNVRVPEM